MAVADLPITAPYIKAERSGHLLPLDGLRGLAIFLVFLCHYFGGDHGHLFSALCRLGWSGVDLFFVLSGFLITGILYDSIGRPNYYKNFYARRVLRIFPIYYLFLAGAITLTAPLTIHWQPQHLFFLVYLGYPAAVIWPSLMTVPIPAVHLWSLSVEEQFYTIWPWLIRKLRTPENIMKACAVAIAFSLALRCALIVLGHDEWAYPFLLCRLDGLALGAIMAIAMRGPAKNIVLRFSPWAVGIGAIAFAGICALRHSVDNSDKLIASVGFSILDIMFAGLLVLSISRWQRPFSWSGLRMLGKYSYGLYLYHLPLLLAFMPLKHSLVARIPSYSVALLAFGGAALACNLVVAAISFHFIEVPILKYKSRFV